ncbi:MAG: 2Fe-2S iron-sulfur cluster binding domain-containing protein [Rhizobiales bacterium]|nr:2Fe-2S iron-sulfur cluster binding domain-containing protein [Hyphomicrobiales bacterium]OJU36401.1 MAG: hypothetical protein BGN94_04645 [Rhizobiales bacterium 68-8]
MSESVTIIFEKRDGERIEVAARTGASVMETAVVNNVAGIEAECGGSCICATCHVYCDHVADGVLDEMSPIEDDMLDLAAAERRPSSRLSCQIRVGPALDRAVFVIPEAQF